MCGLELERCPNFGFFSKIKKQRLNFKFNRVFLVHINRSQSAEKVEFIRFMTFKSDARLGKEILLILGKKPDLNAEQKQNYSLTFFVLITRVQPLTLFHQS